MGKAQKELFCGRDNELCFDCDKFRLLGVNRQLDM